MLGLCELSPFLFHPLISDPAKILIKSLIKFLQLELCPGWEVQGADPGALPCALGALGSSAHGNERSWDAAGAGVEAGDAPYGTAKGINKGFGNSRMSSQQGRGRSLGCWDGWEREASCSSANHGGLLLFFFSKGCQRVEVGIKKGLKNK